MEIPRIIAKRELRSRNLAAPLDSDKVFELVLASTEDEDQADKAKVNFIMEQMKTGEEVR